MDIDSNLNSFGEAPYFKNKKQTIRDTYKYYINLVREPSKEGENLKELISSDIPLLLFEENLHLILIDSLHLEKEVVKIFLSQNDYQISKVLGFKWFFKNLSSEFSIKELFPFISVSVRHKVIHRLSKYLENAEEAYKYFEFIRNTYGPKRANYLLPRCRLEFIVHYYEKMKHTFQNHYDVPIVFNISKRYPEIGVQILSNIFEMKKEDEDLLSKYKKVILYLSGNHPDLIVPFLKKNHLYIPSNTFGIKLTKKLGAKLTRDLFPVLIKRFLFREKILFSKLNHQEQIKYLAGALFVDNENLFFHNWADPSKMYKLFKLIPDEKRLDVIESVFREVFNSKFTDHSKHWTCEILELLPTVTREPFLQKIEVFLKEMEKAELDVNIDNYSFSPESPEKLIYLYNSCTAFEKFKEILRKCPTAAKREAILTLMVKNCSINKDLRVLQQVVEYVADHHRNDDYRVISSFTNAICNHFPSSKLNSVIFEKLEELTYFVCLKRSSDELYRRWKELHIYYRLDNNMKVDVNNFFEFIVLKSDVGQSFVRDYDSKQSKTFILATCKEIMQWIRDKTLEKSNDPQQEILLMSLISTCMDFNKKNKNDRIFVKDVEGLKEILKRKSDSENLCDLGAQEWPLDIWEMMFVSKCKGDIFGPHNRPIYLTYIVKRSPELIVKYLDGVVNTLLSSHLNLDKTFLALFFVTCAFLEVTERVKRMILNEIENANTLKRQKAALTLYSHMCGIEEFSSAVEKYVPKGKRVSQKKNDFEKIQILIPALVKNVKPRWKNLEFIFKFYFGDFLEIVVPSLLVCCYHTRYDLIIPFLKKKLNTAPLKISYKKNIIKIILEVLDRKERLDFCIKYWDECKHYSIRSVFIRFISKLFVEDPSREAFQVLEKCILESDENTIEALPGFWEIPKEFLRVYARALWLFSESREKNFRDGFRTKIFWAFNRNNINVLETEFCETIIRDYLFNSFSDNGIETFTVSYLQSEPEFIEKRVHFVLDLIKTRKPSSKDVFAFLRILIFKSNEDPEKFCDIVRILLEDWPEYPLGVLFKERILLNYYSIYFKVKKTISDCEKISVEFGNELKTFLSTIENLNDFVFIYAKVLRKFFKTMDAFNAIVVVKELMSENPGRALSILAILSLPKESVFWHNMKGEIDNPTIIKARKVLNEIFNNVESYNDNVVELYIRSKFDVVEPYRLQVSKLTNAAERETY